jgi:hypothetical protein
MNEPQLFGVIADNRADDTALFLRREQARML